MVLVVVVVLAAAAWAVVHVVANRAFDEAASAVAAAALDAGDATVSLRALTDDVAGSVHVAGVIVETSSTAEDLVDANARAELADAATASAALVDKAASTLQDSVRAEETPKPLWTWDLLTVAPRLTGNASGLGEYAKALASAQDAVEDADAALLDAARDLYASVPPLAAALEKANVSARAFVLLDLRYAAAAAAEQTGLGTGAANAFTTYAAMAANLKHSQQVELAEKAGPLLATRLEIEAFARSIAGGVVLDFDWAPIVAGVGGSDGIGGTATWAVVRGGFSTITLSNSVAETWPSADARALVAHEVGHAITSKCSEMFDSANADANEAWATAWAISMGHTATGNGVQAYGYPPQSLIDKAATCR
ncbi:hypothetical protein GCM10009775_28940 [Microbacterium aoyamense]|uniref:Uncharacterized protein n=1 Tax=Microbacterium aoyamense TaxID=344166 RepID=A0ABP5B9N5_9MICO|nr:hypothetical protein [Microbacterium aoyamense]